MKLFNRFLIRIKNIFHFTIVYDSHVNETCTCVTGYAGRPCRFSALNWNTRISGCIASLYLYVVQCSRGGRAVGWCVCWLRKSWKTSSPAPHAFPTNFWFVFIILLLKCFKLISLLTANTIHIFSSEISLFFTKILLLNEEIDSANGAGEILGASCDYVITDDVSHVLAHSVPRRITHNISLLRRGLSGGQECVQVLSLIKSR